MNVTLPVKLDAGDVACNFMRTGGSYDELIDFIIELDAHMADYDFTTILISKLAKSLSADFTARDRPDYDQFIDSLKSK
jgi:hypothetical protein|uniref:Uncharacterized protein n=1 Tax=Myoviridae sp. ctnjE18 TaxID=2827706 RepID=A0A8S5STL9_9CAUD|nr:MAG TPA: hypothetical protein [Myoviridae sp. ctnjE18]